MHFLTIFTVVTLAGTLSGTPLDTITRAGTYELNPHIIGGNPAADGSIPHMVALVSGHHLQYFMCGGSIINKYGVLTAAHCIEPFVYPWGGLVESFGGLIGTNDLNDKRLSVKFTRHTLHPNYDRFRIKSDIGFLYATQPIPLGDKVAVIPLCWGYIDGGEESYVSGWGLSETGDSPTNLVVLSVNTISSEQCAEGIRDHSQHSWNPVPFDPLVEICTYHSPGRGTCFGDSGSALVSKRHGCQIGIVSWGFPCAIGAPDVYCRISHFRDFITSL